MKCCALNYLHFPRWVEQIQDASWPLSLPGICYSHIEWSLQILTVWQLLTLHSMHQNAVIINIHETYIGKTKFSTEFCLPGCIVVSPCKMSLRVKPVATYLVSWNSQPPFCFSTIDNRSNRSLQLDTGIRLPLGSTSFKNLAVAFANISELEGGEENLKGTNYFVCCYVFSS